jgi:hypothetical protein
MPKFGTIRRGGLESGSVYTGLLDFGLKLDLEKALGWRGASLRLARLTYQAQITKWLSIQPELQVIINPGGNQDLTTHSFSAGAYQLHSRIMSLPANADKRLGRATRRIGTRRIRANRIFVSRPHPPPSDLEKLSDPPTEGMHLW